LAMRYAVQFTDGAEMRSAALADDCGITVIG
jgi:hypothetical protein